MTDKKDQPGASYIKCLIDMAQSDGWVDEHEILFLSKAAGKFNFSIGEIRDIKKHHRRVEFIPPADPEEKIALFYDIVQMMMIDRNIDEKEIKLCNKYASVLGFGQENIRGLIEIIHNDIAQNLKRETTLHKIINNLHSQSSN